jgi:hypothetical protein
VGDLAVELSDGEVRTLGAQGLDFRFAKGRNFDGVDVNIVLLALSSAAVVKAVCGVLIEIVKRRPSGKIKINGVELSNVSEATIRDLIERNEIDKRSTRRSRDRS